MEWINDRSNYLFLEDDINQKDDQDSFIEFDNFNDYYFNS